MLRWPRSAGRKVPPNQVNKWGMIMQILTAVIVIGLLATSGALLTGIVSMGRGGEFDRLHSHQLMFMRVGLQGITLLCLFVALFILH